MAMRTSAFLLLALTLTLAACNSEDMVGATTGTISGSISMEAGTPGSAGNARVALYTSYDDWNSDDFVFQTTADGNGNYTLSNIPPGTYFIDAWKDIDNSDTLNDPDFFGVYGNFDLDVLTPIALSAGQTQTVSFSMTFYGDLIQKAMPGPAE